MGENRTDEGDGGGGGGESDADELRRRETRAGLDSQPGRAPAAAIERFGTRRISAAINQTANNRPRH